MPPRISLSQKARRFLAATSTLAIATTHTARAQPPPGFTDAAPPPATTVIPKTTTTYIRRERATRLLTIAATVQPDKTAAALRLARSTIRATKYSSLHPHDATFLKHVAKDVAARAVASAAGGAAASYAILRFTLLVIPLVPSLFTARLAVSLVSLGAVGVELAGVPDVATVELLLMRESRLAHHVRKAIERYDPHLILLRNLDRYFDASDVNSHYREHAFSFSHHASHPSLCDAFDADIHSR